MGLTKEEIETWVNEPIESFTTGEGSNKGDNVASEILRIQVKTVSGKEHTLVYKQLPTLVEGDDFAVRLKIFWRENRFYETIAPAIESSAAQRLAQINSNEKLAIPIPKFYAGFNNDKDDYVCLGDLRPEGYKMPDKRIGLDLPQMKLAMTKIAEFHALSYYYLKQAGEGIFLEELNKPYLMKQWLIPAGAIYGDPNSEEVKMETAMLTKWISDIYKNSIELVQQHAIGSDGEKLASRMPGQGNAILNNAYKIASSTTLGTDFKYFPLIIHGDLWLNNLLFSYDEQGQPKDMKIVDFQFTRRGNIYEDLNYFVNTSSTAEFRKTNQINILHAYYDSFEKTLSKLNYPLPLGFTRGNFIDGFFENLLPAFIFLTFALPLQIGDEGEDPEVSPDLPSRLRWKMERAPLAILRAEETAREMVRMGLL